MRYYKLVVTPPPQSPQLPQLGLLPQVPASPIAVQPPQPRIWTSYPNGPDPQAQNILYDMTVLPFATPGGNYTITIEGIGLDDLMQANQFAGSFLELSVGMGGGLPLENPSQINVISKGLIFQSFGNWAGTNMTLDFVVIPGYFTRDNPGMFLLKWAKGQPLGEALTQTLQTAYRGTPMAVNVNVSSAIVAPENVTHHVTSIEALSQYLAQYTASSKSGAVQIVADKSVILAYDKTYKSPPKQIEYTDFIGQPTWIHTIKMQIKLVARGDINVGDTIILPQGYLTNAPGAITTTSASYPSTNRYKSTFTQGFDVVGVRQIGNFRSSDSGEWATILDCVVNYG